MIKRVKHRLLIFFFVPDLFACFFPCVFMFVFFVSLQLRQFRKLKAHYGRFPDLMCDNYRPIQPLKGRKVYSVRNNN